MITETAMASVAAVSGTANIKLMADLAFSKWYMISMFFFVALSVVALSLMIWASRDTDGEIDAGVSCGIAFLVLCAGWVISIIPGSVAYLIVIW